MEKNLKIEWEYIMNNGNASPYVFRTRLERILKHTLKYAKNSNDSLLNKLCERINDKLKYISDQSNQTTDGILVSYTVLQQDFERVCNRLSD